MLVLYVAGLYASFLAWSLLQEKINTTPYGGEYLRAPLAVNLVQLALAIAVSYAYCQLSTRTNPFSIITKNNKTACRFYAGKFATIAVTASLSGPMGYESLKHVDYLVFLLAKSCKLIPVMLVHFLLYRTRFAFQKYVVALSVTAGVAVFTLAGSKAKLGANDGDVVKGMAQLIGSMLLDGLTNSTQDQLFKQQKQLDAAYKVNGTVLMCVLNTFMVLLTLAYTLVFNAQEILDAWAFVQRHPEALQDVLAFATLGSVGQIFVFIILEKYDSIVLTTATVTRKMLSMVLSVVLFGHPLTRMQVSGVALVFGGIACEALWK